MIKYVFVLALAVLSITANECDKYSKKYQNDQFWLSVPKNCHLYISCTPNGDGTHTQVDISCGKLYWNQEYLTCVVEIPPFARCDKKATPPTTQATTTYPFECNYVVNPKNKREFKPKDTNKQTFKTYQSCKKNFHFDLEKCTCLMNEDAPANSCDKKCFLKYEFNGNLEDSSCTNAAAQVVKGGIGYVKSRFGSAAVFNGSGYIDISAMRNIFAGNYVTEFSVSMFFRTSNYKRPELLFDNGEIGHKMTVLLGYVAKQNFLAAQIRVSGGRIKNRMLSVFVPMKNRKDVWHHVAFIYKNGALTLTLDAKQTKTRSILAATKDKVDYTIDNMDEPLSLGGRSSGKFYFNGMMDEFRVFKRALSPSEVRQLSKNTF